MKLVWQLEYSESLTYDQRILEILKVAGIPLPLNFLSRISGIPKDRCCRVLQSLERYGYIRKSTIQQAAFFKITKY